MLSSALRQVARGGRRKLTAFSAVLPKRSYTGRSQKQPLWVTGLPVVGCVGLALGATMVYYQTPDAQDSKVVDLVSMEEVRRHNTVDDAWIVIDGKVYDITSWIPLHPGGSYLLEARAGKDVSHEFRNFRHTPGARNLMSGLHIANVERHRPGGNSTSRG